MRPGSPGTDSHRVPLHRLYAKSSQSEFCILNTTCEANLKRPLTSKPLNIHAVWWTDRRAQRPKAPQLPPHLSQALHFLKKLQILPYSTIRRGVHSTCLNKDGHLEKENLGPLKEKSWMKVMLFADFISLSEAPRMNLSIGSDYMGCIQINYRLVRS